MTITIDVVEPFNLRNGLVFASHDGAAVESIEMWADQNFCPLTKARSNKASITKADIKICARRDFKCSHGMKYWAGGEPRDRGKESSTPDAR